MKQKQLLQQRALKDLLWCWNELVCLHSAEHNGIAMHWLFIIMVFLNSDWCIKWSETSPLFLVGYSCRPVSFPLRENKGILVYFWHPRRMMWKYLWIKVVTFLLQTVSRSNILWTLAQTLCISDYIQAGFHKHLASKSLKIHCISVMFWKVLLWLQEQRW